MWNWSSVLANKREEILITWVGSVFPEAKEWEKIYFISMSVQI